MKNQVDKSYYPDIVIIDEVEYGAAINAETGKVTIPCDDIPDIDYGKVIQRKISSKNIDLRVTDFHFREGQSLEVGTNQPNIIDLWTINDKANQQKPKNSSPTINIGTITSDNVQIGDNNVQLHNATIKEIVEHVSKSNDPDAKSKLRSLLENPTVSSLVGAGAAALLAALG